jgi:YD repeat-containing protein
LPSVSGAEGTAVSLGYDAPGKDATQVTDPKNAVATFPFDRFGRTTDSVDGAGNVISNIFDTNGNLDKVVDPANNAWEFAFDAAGDLSSGQDPLGNPVLQPEELHRGEQRVDRAARRSAKVTT